MRKYWCCVLATCFVTQVHSQVKQDSIFAAKGTVTIITSAQPVLTFQLGDGKNPDYDYRIIDGNIILIRAVNSNPKPTNVVIRAGKALHYFVLAYREHPAIGGLKYSITDEQEILPATRPDLFLAKTIKRSDLIPINNLLSRLAENEPPANVDTSMVQKIAEDFGKYHKSSRKYKATEDGIQVRFVTTLTLNGFTYFNFRIFNRQSAYLEIDRPILLHKPKEHPAFMKLLPVIFQRSARVAPGMQSDLVLVVSSWQRIKKEQLIFLLKSKNTEWKAALYLPVKTLR
jgi:hypothetical protein